VVDGQDRQGHFLLPERAQRALYERGDLTATCLQAGHQS
jgi:hypothetical protein